LDDDRRFVYFIIPGHRGNDGIAVTGFPLEKRDSQPYRYSLMSIFSEKPGDYTISSFPRRRESRRECLDSRLRGNDVDEV